MRIPAASPTIRQRIMCSDEVAPMAASSGCCSVRGVASADSADTPGHHHQHQRKAVGLDHRSQQPDGARAEAEGHRQPHAGHARAQAVVDIAHDHRVGEGNGAEDHHHRAQQRTEDPPALGQRGQHQQRHLAEHDGRGTAA
jgi:hypothetical protein